MSTISRSTRRTLYATIFALVGQSLLPILPTFQPIVRAADRLSAGDGRCISALNQYLDQGILPQDLVSDTAITDASELPGNDDLSEESLALIADIEDQVFPDFHYLVNLSDLRRDSNIPQSIRSLFTTEYALEQVEAYGTSGAAYYKLTTDLSGDIGTEYVAVCYNSRPDLSMDSAFSPSLPVSINSQKLVSFLENPNPKITFRNPLDKIALTGEVCKGGLVGNQSEWSEENPPCPGFDPADDVFANGEWDAPKVDQRVLRALVYLVTPVADGGAGREHIRVKKIIQFGKNDEVSISGVDQSAIDEASAENDDLPPRTSGHYIGEALRDPPYRPNPQNLAQAVDIDEIDNLRVTQKVVVTQSTPLTGTKRTTTYTALPPTPIKVANQTTNGAGSGEESQGKQDLLSMSRRFGNEAIVSLLTQFGLDSLSLDVSEMDASGYADISLLIGRSILEQALGIPRGSLVGIDLESVLNTIGKRYAEQQLGLLPDSLNTSSDDPKEIVRHIGRTTVEAALKLPAGSLKSDSELSEKVLESIGRSYLERNVFQVSPGTLNPAPSSPLGTVGDLLARLGEGRIEEKLQLPAGSTRVASYAELRAAINKTVPYLIDPARANNPNTEDYTYADLFSTRLGLEFSNYQETGRNMYGFSPDDFVFPSIKVAGGGFGVERFKQLVGSRVIELSVGFFAQSGIAERIPSERFGTPIEDVSTIRTPEGTLVVDRVLNNIYGLDVTKRPVSDSTYGKNDRTGKWCGLQDNRYAPLFGGIKENVPDTYTAIERLKKWQNISFGGFFGFGGGINTYCNEQTIASANVDLRPLESIQDVLISTQPKDRIDFVNKEKAPKFSDFDENDDIPDFYENAAFNLATLFFYNDTRNQVTIPKNYVLTNTVAPDQSSERSDEIDETSPTTLPQAHLSCPVAANINSDIIVTVRAWDPVTPTTRLRVRLTDSTNTDTVAYPSGGGFAEPGEYKTSFTFRVDASALRSTRVFSVVAETNIGQKSRVASCAITFRPFTVREIFNELRSSDPGLSQRIDIVEQLYATQSSADPFNLASLLSLRGSALNDALIDRINLLTVRPSNTGDEARYLGEYSDPSYNGWLFAVNDLQKRLYCIANEAPYTPTRTDSVYIHDCEGRATAVSEEIKTDSIRLAKIRGAADQLSSLADQLKRMRDTLLKSLQNGAVNELPSGLATQSGYSVGLDIPSSSFASDANSRLIKTPRYSRDLIRMLIAPQGATSSFRQPVDLRASISPFFSVIDAAGNGFTEIGRIQLSKQLSEDPFAQQVIAGNLVPGYNQILALAGGDTAAVATAAQRHLFNLQVSEQKILDGGLDRGDLARIFLLDSGRQTFERIGQEELVRTIWARASNNAAARGRKDRLLINRQATQLGQELGFYRTRLASAYTLANQLLSETTSNPLSDLPGQRFSDSRSRLQSLLANPTKDAATNTGLQELARSLDPFISIFARHAEASSNVPGSIQDALASLRLTLNEVAAGKKLFDPHSYADTQKNTTAKQAQEALFTSTAGRIIDAQELLSLGELIRTFDPRLDAGELTIQTGYGPYTQRLNSYSTRLGSLVLDASFLLQQQGGFYTWFSLGSSDRQWSVERLNLALGYASIRGDDANEATYTSLQRGTISNELRTSYTERGTILFERAARTHAYQLLPYGGDRNNGTVTPADFVAILQGDIRPVIWKIGAANLDFAYNVPGGTTRELISPICRTASGVQVACSNTTSEPWTNPSTVRDTILAREGMKRIGQAIPNFPSYFNLVSQGNAYTNWGNAVLTENLGLSANSFLGNITDSCANPNDLSLRCRNSVSQIMRSFGIQKTPFEKYFQGVRSKLSNLLYTNETARAIPLETRKNFLAQFEQIFQEQYLAKVSIERLVNDPEGFWVGSDETRRNSEAGRLARDDASTFFTSNVLQQLWTLPTNEGELKLPDVLAEQVRRILLEKVGAADIIYKPDELPSLDRYVRQDTIPLDFFNTSTESYAGLVGEDYRTLIDRFQARLGNISTSLGISLTDFLKGRSSGNTVSTSLGNNQINNQEILVKLFDTNLNLVGSEWARSAITNFAKIIGNTGVCSGSVSTGEFLTNLLRGGYDQPFSRCVGLGSSGGFASDLSKLLFAPNAQVSRDLILDKFLGMGFSMQIEQGLGLQPGTLKTLVLDPGRGQAMLLTQGITKVTEKLFADVNFADTCRTNRGGDALGLNCMAGEVINELKNALLAGFYDPNAPPGREWALSFNEQRFTDAFTNIKNTAVDRILQRVSRSYLGFEISRGELDAILGGDTQTITDLGLQFLMNSLNSKLGDSTLGRVAALVGQTWAQYRIIRDAGALSIEDIALTLSSGNAGMRDRIFDAVCGSLSGEALAACRGLGNGELLTRYRELLDTANKGDIESLLGLIDDGALLDQLRNSPLAMFVDFNRGDIRGQLRNLNTADAAGVILAQQLKDTFNITVQQEFSNRKFFAQANLQAIALEIVASNFNIALPANFTSRFFGGTSIERNQAIGDLAISLLTKTNSPLGKLLSDAGISATQIIELGRTFLSGDITKQQDLLKNLFGINGLVASIDTKLTEWLSQNANLPGLPDGMFSSFVAWGVNGFRGSDLDKDLTIGNTTFQSFGSFVKDIGPSFLTSFADKQFGFKAGTSQQLLNAYKAIQAYQKALSAVGLSAAERASAIKNAAAGLIQVGLSLALSFFGDTLAQLDKQLGLPPGTLNLALQIGVNALLASINPAFANPVGIYIAVIFYLNSLFGSVSVDISVIGSGDGYYPYYSKLNPGKDVSGIDPDLEPVLFGEGEATQWINKSGDTKANDHYGEVVSVDPLLGEFDAQKPQVYRESLREIARNKVKGVLIDLLRMPYSDWAQKNRFSSYDTMIAQAFTYGGADFDPIQDSAVAQTLNLRGPMDGYEFGGYGLASGRCPNYDYDTASGIATCTPDANNRSGFWPDPRFSDNIHLRW